MGLARWKLLQIDVESGFDVRQIIVRLTIEKKNLFVLFGVPIHFNLQATLLIKVRELEFTLSPFLEYLSFQKKRLKLTTKVLLKSDRNLVSLDKRLVRRRPKHTKCHFLTTIE